MWSPDESTGKNISPSLLTYEELERIAIQLEPPLFPNLDLNLPQNPYDRCLENVPTSTVYSIPDSVRKRLDTLYQRLDALDKIAVKGKYTYGTK